MLEPKSLNIVKQRVGVITYGPEDIKVTGDSENYYTNLYFENEGNEKQNMLNSRYYITLAFVPGYAASMLSPNPTKNVVAL